MALKFKGDDIPGFHGPLVYTTSEPALRFSKFWDLVGEPVIAGRPGGRYVTCWILLFDQWTGNTPKKLLDYLDELDDQVGEHGSIEESGNIVQKLTQCTFLGFEPSPVGGGQDDPGPIRDDAGTLWPIADWENAEAQWWVHGILRWRQARS